MGKKKVVKKTEEEVLKEKEKREKKVKKGVKVKAPKIVKQGRVYISSSYNNMLITLTDPKGNVLTWTSAGKLGFKGTKKATPFAASEVAKVLAQAAKEAGIKEVKVLVKGIGSGRDSALRSLATHGLNIKAIEDVTPIPHNGCRPSKPRRV